MEQLNTAQREAVVHGDGPLLVVAGAGSGKTRTLACRVAYLIERGVPPDRILLLTFTRRAAREMLSRAARLIASSRGGATGRVWGGTFHAVGNRLLRVYGGAVGLPSGFTVLDQADTADLMNVIRGDLGLGRGERRFPRKDTLASIYSRMVNGRTKLGDVLDRWFPWCVKEADGVRDVFARYTVRKREQGVLDYEDLLLYWHALATAPQVRETVAGLFDHILVDEYQDTNAVQADILHAMRRVCPNLMVVGDDAQAIYSFRAATNRNLLEFPDRFPGAGVVKLERNYRSTEPILQVSNAVIALSRERHEKTLWTDRRSDRRPTLLSCLDEPEQSHLVCRHVIEHREQGTPLRRQAVLFRTGHHSDLLEVELSRRNIPFVKYGGLKFLEAAHVKDVLCMLRILENPHDEVSWFRVLQLLEGVGPASARVLSDALAVRRRSPGAEGADQGPTPLRRLIEDPPAVPAVARSSFEALRKAMADCLGLEGGASEPESSPAVQIERLRRFLEPVFERLYESPASRLRDIEQLEKIAAGSTTRARFLAELTLDPPISTADLAGPPLLDEDYLILSTIHSAKGGEWDVVHVIHASDGNIPSDMATGEAEAIEEERRLFYVALTRARDALYVYFPQRYYRRRAGLDDAHSYAQLTRFLPSHVQELFDRKSRDGGARQDRTPASLSGSAAAVDGFLADLWT